MFRLGLSLPLKTLGFSNFFDFLVFLSIYIYVCVIQASLLSQWCPYTGACVFDSRRARDARSPPPEVGRELDRRNAIQERKNYAAKGLQKAIEGRRSCTGTGSCTTGGRWGTSSTGARSRPMGHRNSHTPALPALPFHSTLPSPCLLPFGEVSGYLTALGPVLHGSLSLFLDLSPAVSCLSASCT